MNLSRVASRAVAASMLFLVPVTGAFAEESSRPMEVPEGHELVDRIVAQVETRLITLAEVDQAVITNRNLGIASTGGMEARRLEALRALIDEQLILAEADKLQLGVSDEEIEQHLAQTRAQNGWTEEDLRVNVGRLGMTVDEYREVTRKEKTKAKIIGVKVGSRVSVSEEAVQRVLDAEYEGGTVEPEARVSILLRQVAPGASQEEAKQARKYAQWIRSQADAAPERFADLARKFSEHEATRLYGGDLGYFKKGAIALPELESAAFNTPVGGVSAVLETAQGLMIVLVTDRRKAAVENPDALRGAVFNRLYAQQRLQAYESWLEELRRDSFVRIKL